jgi:serine/threonine protein kinase
VPVVSDFGSLNSDQWRELCDCADRLEQTLLGGATAVDLRLFLPAPDAPHRRAVLSELIKTELEARYRRHEGLPLEEFLKLYPELGGRDDLPASLVYEEYRVRRLHGDRPELATYRDRFPRQFEQLGQLLREHPVPEPASRPEPPTVHQPMPTQADARPQPQPPGQAPTRSDATRSDGQGTGTTTSGPVPSSQGLVLSGGLGYQKLERLGRGEFGEVWRALAPGGVEVAIKIILRTLDHEASQRELKVLEKIRQLRHPFLLQTHQYQAERDHLVIVLELADGSLSDRFKECKARGLDGIPVEELVTYFTQAAEALDFLHSQHVAHRDIKPQNLLRLRGYAKVADFGLARSQDQTVDDASVMCGTPHYMAPEMWRQQVSVHSDQYSLAATYVEMRLGRRLFPGKTPYEVAEHHLKSDPQLDPLSPAEQAVVRRALAKAPDQRYPNCVAFAHALRAAVAPKKAPPPRWSRMKKAVFAGLVLALAGVLGVLLYFKLNTKPPPPGWEPEYGAGLVWDARSQQYHYRRLVHYVGAEKIKVVMIAIPPRSLSDPPLFYIMENKVWNDLFRAFMNDPDAEKLFTKYKRLQGADEWFRGEWEQGAHAPAKGVKALGVGSGRGKMPVLRVTVTEAHCFAEWLDGLHGRLPSQVQWSMAAGRGWDQRDGPFDGPEMGVAVGLGADGPWPVDQGEQDKSIYGCRQMAANAKEWTRTVPDPDDNDNAEIPLQKMLTTKDVLVCGQDYAANKPLTFEMMRTPYTVPCTENSPEIGFRIVLEP